MKPWTERPFLAVDTETTGVDPFSDRIVEVAAVTILPDGSPVDPWSTIVDPGIEIPESAAAVHGITTERARVEGVSPAEAIAMVAERMFAAGPLTPVVLYNATFDFPILMAEAARHEVEFPCFAPVLDPYLLDRLCDKYRKGKRQLTLVAEHYGVELGDSAHGALADAIAAGQVMRQIVAHFPKIGEHTLAGVYLRQVQGHERDRLAFVDWQRRNNDPTFEKAPGWPIPAGSAS